MKSMNFRFIRSLLPGIALLVGLGCASDSERERAPCLRYLGCDPKVECEKNAKASCESDSRRDENREDFDWDRCYSSAVAACLEDNEESRSRVR